MAERSKDLSIADNVREATEAIMHSAINNMAQKPHESDTYVDILGSLMNQAAELRQKTLADLREVNARKLTTFPEAQE
jgi:hypothetical protein